MKSTFKIILIAFFITFSLLNAIAQISINDDGASPDVSAMLDVTSSSKGILIPRMTSAERTAISSPATGLLVYDTNENSFWYYNSSAWSEVGASGFVSENGVIHMSDNSNDFVLGTDSLNRATGATEKKLFFDKSKGAFRVGGTHENTWDESNIGNYSVGLGYNSRATGESAIAGNGGIASGDYSTAFSTGTASGYYSTAFSAGTASGDYSTAFGSGSTANSYHEFAIGRYNTSYTPNNATAFDSDDRLFVIGNGTSSSDLSDAMIVYKNGNTEINGNLTVSGSVTGSNTAFISENAITHSNNNDDDFVFGADSLNYGSGTEYKFFFDRSKGAFRAGRISNTNWDESNLGSYSAGFGYNTKASGDYSTSFGYSTIASGNHSASFGASTTASGIASTSFGANTIASGGISTSFGYYTEASGDYSTSFGVITKAPSFGEMAIGTYNTTYTPNDATDIDSDDRVFVIGNGTGTLSRSDAMIVYKSGNTEINGALTLNGVFTFPTADGTASQVLATDGNGTLSWTDITENLGDYSATQNVVLNDYWISNDGGSEGIRIDDDGNVGIGTTPTNGKFEVDGSVDNAINNYAYLSNVSSSTAYVSNNSATKEVSIYASDRIVGKFVISMSDERIKDIKGISNGEEDLAILKQIQITNYEFKDKIQEGDTKQKKVIAQQVAKIYPQAVNKQFTEVVPDIYQTATIDKNGWVQTLHCNVSIGEKIQIIFDDKKEILEVLETKENGFRVASTFKNHHSKLETVFVYGRQVNDFHTVDYEAISMLNVSATQQLAKEVKQLRIENQQLKTQVAKINELEAKLNALNDLLRDDNTTANMNTEK